MRATLLTVAAVVCTTLAFGPSVSAQTPTRLTIHNVTLDTSAGVLTITGVDFGRDPVVTVDGQPVVVLPGGSETRLAVQAPAALLTMPGTYRLTVVDPARQAGDGFVVSSQAMTGVATCVYAACTPVAASGTVAAPAGPPDVGPETTPVPHSARGPSSLTVIEDPGPPYRTAIGYHALAFTTGWANTASGYQSLQFNTTGEYNTAGGFQTLANNLDGSYNMASGTFALRTNTTGFGNTASGAHALYSNTTGQRNAALGLNAGGLATTGSYNLFLGADVSGTTADTNTIRIGLPYNGGAGQNQTFIAGIRGTSVTGGEAVLIDAAGKLGSGLAPVGANTVGAAQVINESLTAADLAPNSVGRSELMDGAVTVAKVAFDYAASTSEGGPAIDVACVGCVSASEVSFSFASLGANAFAGTQTIGPGNIDLTPSTATSGNITKSGVPFLHNFGSQNTFLGLNAGNLTMTGANNTVSGETALQANTTGHSNTAVGQGALFRNTTGSYNTVIGAEALPANTTGFLNTATGFGVLVDNTTGFHNTAAGDYALASNTTGANNTAFGHAAGTLSTTGSYNVSLGAGVFGTDADTNTIRIGVPYDEGIGQNRTFIAGIHGTELTGSAVQVFVDANGQLGTRTPLVLASGTATLVTPAALQQQVQEQQATIAELQRLVRDQEATNADLRARLARLEAVIKTVTGRK